MDLGLTLTFRPSFIDASATDQHIIDNGEYTLATNPHTIAVLNLAVIEARSLIELYAPAMDGLGEGDLVWVKVLPA